ncbi:MAG: hypothetical protein LBD20_08015 [Spirochaetaceae bacterium]|jgi:hypothetical protein|nr:hypothetical protein [Spirochaetaceae bacterium]
MKRVFFAVMCTLFLAAPVFFSGNDRFLYAQEATTIVEFMPFEVGGMSAEEGLAIEDLIRDYIRKIKNVLLVFPGVEEIIPRGHIDFVLQGTIYTEDDTYILQLDVLDTKSDTTTTWSSGYRTSSELALKAPAINYAALLAEAGGRQVEAAGEAEEIRVENLLGRWRGSGGIEQVFFLRNGEARAYLSSGAGMELQYRIEQKKIVLEQKSRNDPRYYPGASGPAAKALTAEAEPKRWELSLYKDGQVLKGYLFESAAGFNGTEITVTSKGSVSTAEWTKSAR